MSEVTLTCAICLTTTTLHQTEGLSERVVAYHFAMQGWDVANRLCAQHRGEAGALRIWAARLGRAQCTARHDRQWMMRDIFAPRSLFCQVPAHYWNIPASAKLVVMRNT